MTQEPSVSDSQQLEVLAVKKQKAVLKAKLTRCANFLISLLDQEEVPSYRDIKAFREKHNEAKDAVVGALIGLAELYESVKELDKAEMTTDEIEIVLEEYKSVEKQVQLYIASNRDELSVKSMDIKIGDWITKQKQTEPEKPIVANQ